MQIALQPAISNCALELHSGEVIFENGDVFGDGVNIASRIQSVALPGSIYISGSVHDEMANKKEIQTKFIKEERLKNVKEPVRMYEVMVVKHKETMPHGSDTGKEKLQMKSIAVLPFVNMSNDPEQDYFCDGISEEILNTLMHLNNLRVMSRTSSFALKDKNLDAREIGEKLRVQSFLEGSVRKSGKRLRITTNLINTADGSHLWSDRYDRDLEDIFAIQEDIATNVATALKGFLTSKEKEKIRRPETNIKTYEYFLKGRQFFVQLIFTEAIKYFKKAIKLDAGYALAYAGMADAYSWLYQWEGAKQSDLDAAEKNSLKALSLAPKLADSHLSRAFVLSLSKRYDEADHEFEEAIRRNPNLYLTYYLYGRECFGRGDIEKSAELFLKASEVQPEDYQSILMYAQSLKVLGKNSLEVSKEGIRRARRQLELDPEDRRVLSLVSGNLYDVGEEKEAFEWIEKALRLYPNDAGVIINATCLFSKAGKIEKALKLLEKAVSKGYGKRDWIEHDPDYDNLRNEPRFKELLNKMQ